MIDYATRAETFDSAAEYLEQQAAVGLTEVIDALRGGATDAIAMISLTGQVEAIDQGLSAAERYRDRAARARVAAEANAFNEAHPL